MQEREFTIEDLQDLDELQEQLDLQDSINTQEELLPPIELSIDNIFDCQFDRKEFQKGVTDASYISGYFTALKNCGIHNETILTILLNKDTVAHNLELARINSETSIKVAEKQQVVMEKNQL